MSIKKKGKQLLKNLSKDGDFLKQIQSIFLVFLQSFQGKSQKHREQASSIPLSTKAHCLHREQTKKTVENYSKTRARVSITLQDWQKKLTFFMKQLYIFEFLNIILFLKTIQNCSQKLTFENCYWKLLFKNCFGKCCQMYP